MKRKLISTIIKSVLPGCCLLLMLTMPSCKKFVEVPPPATKLAGDAVYATDATAAAVLTGIYTGLNVGSLATGYNSISYRSGLSADEFTYDENLGNLALAEYYANSINPQSIQNNVWTEAYKYINVANTALEGLETSSKLTPIVKQRLTGEALFVRAFLHFYLVNLYGDVPLVTNSDYRINNAIGRSSAQAVYAQIITDLKKAQTLLGSDYLDANITSAVSDRVRPNQAVATAMLARVYLYTQDWANAEIEATKLISNTSLYSLTDLNDVFSTTSTEAIWQLAPVVPDQNTLDGNQFILNSVPDYDHPASLSPMLLQAFEPNDQRKVNWVGKLTDNNTDYYFPYKYKVSSGTPVTEYLTVFRLAEQYLIRAEARAQLSKLSGSRDDLNAIRQRAGLPATAENDQQQLLNSIYHERQVELFTEWGHRWLDLKRTKTIDAVMPAAALQKGSVWKSTAQLYPVPQGDILRDPKLTQNPGY